MGSETFAVTEEKSDFGLWRRWAASLRFFLRMPMQRTTRRARRKPAMMQAMTIPTRAPLDNPPPGVMLGLLAEEVLAGEAASLVEDDEGVAVDFELPVELAAAGGFDVAAEEGFTDALEDVEPMTQLLF